jgi:hypothetical protein
MKIIAVGMNYALHNKELGHTHENKEPVIFLKPDSAILKGWQTNVSCSTVSLSIVQDYITKVNIYPLITKFFGQKMFGRN